MNVKLGELIRPAGSRARDRTAPVYSVTKHRGFVRSDEYFTKQVHGKDLSAYKLVEPGDFGYATIHLDEGSIGRAPEHALISPMYTVFSVDERRVDPDFLFRYLKSPFALARYSQMGNGTAERRKSITLDALGRLTVPLPPLPEQRRIATILDEADALREARRRSINALEELRTSTIAAAMSNPVQELPLSDLVPRIESGKSPVCRDSPAAPGEWGVLKLGAISSGRFLAEQNKALPADMQPFQSAEIRAGDVLISRKNTVELVGASVYVETTRPRLLMSDLVYRLPLIPNAPISGRYLQAYLSSLPARAEIRAMAGGSAASMSNISKERLSRLPVPIPSTAEHERVVKALEQISELHAKFTAHFHQLDSLFASLQHRAFRGEL